MDNLTRTLPRGAAQTTTTARTEQSQLTAEEIRLQQAHARSENWQRWGTYLAERQWATVREDYSEFGDCWDYFPHDHARSRAYRWGEDGLLGFCDRQCRLCFAIALWNERDPILKERLFGLTGPQGNHGEDVKECYYYLDATPTNSYVKLLYKYPQAEFPYEQLIEENRRRGKGDPEFELADTGIFSDNRYFDVLSRICQGRAERHSGSYHHFESRPGRRAVAPSSNALVPKYLVVGLHPRGLRSQTQNRIRSQRRRHRPARHARRHTTWRPTTGLAHTKQHYYSPITRPTRSGSSARQISHRTSKMRFTNYVVGRRVEAVSSNQFGTKAAWHYVLEIAAGAEVIVRLRLTAAGEATPNPFGGEFDQVFAQRIREADEFFATHLRAQKQLTVEEQNVARQAYAGLVCSKQFYHFAVKDWLAGDPEMPSPPSARLGGRNHDWPNLFNRDIISMPDKWEYPWYAAWDLAFHMLPMARLDGEFAKNQLLLFLREWYMHPNGQIPAYEFAFGDVNPPVHAWACWRVYKMTALKGCRDRLFLRRAFHKLLLNFTWWVNRKDPNGRNLFAGGFLGLDNIGVFDRSKPLPNGGTLEQADGTAWMAFYCATMLSMALELAADDPSYEDIASKFFEHFIAIIDAMNCLGGMGLWDEQDGFYYDVLNANGTTMPLRIRSMVGIIPLFAAEVLQQDVIDALPDFKKRLSWFTKHRQDIARHIAYFVPDTSNDKWPSTLASLTCCTLAGAAHSSSPLRTR